MWKHKETTNLPWRKGTEVEIYKRKTVLKKKHDQEQKLVSRNKTRKQALDQEKNMF